MPYQQLSCISNTLQSQHAKPSFTAIFFHIQVSVAVPFRIPTRRIHRAWAQWHPTSRWTSRGGSHGAFQKAANAERPKWLFHFFWEMLRSKCPDTSKFSWILDILTNTLATKMIALQNVLCYKLSSQQGCINKFQKHISYKLFRLKKKHRYKLNRGSDIFPMNQPKGLLQIVVCLVLDDPKTLVLQSAGW